VQYVLSFSDAQQQALKELSKVFTGTERIRIGLSGNFISAAHYMFLDYLASLICDA
jgi:hypothetical protein